MVQTGLVLIDLEEVSVITDPPDIPDEPYFYV